MSRDLFSRSGTNVNLTTSRQSPDTLYTLQIAGISDWSGNVIAEGSQTILQSWAVVAGPDLKVVPPPVNLFRDRSGIWITWPYGSFLQSADDLSGPWQTLLNPDFLYKIPGDGAARFYRAFFDP